MIRIEHAGYVYMQGGPFEKTALSDVNLDIKQGEFIGLIGHTGSGKSTLIQLLNGLLKPTHGIVTVGGRNLCDKRTDMRKVRFDVGLVMQYPESLQFFFFAFLFGFFFRTDLALPFVSSSFIISYR